jgi:hypothetical protein
MAVNVTLDGSRWPSWNPGPGQKNIGNVVFFKFLYKVEKCS